MDTRLNYPEIIRKILTDFAETYTRNGGCRLRILFDDKQKSYMVLHIGWHGNRYIHNAMIHIELIELLRVCSNPVFLKNRLCWASVILKCGNTRNLQQPDYSSKCKMQSAK